MSFPDVRSPDYLPLRTIVKFYQNHLDHRSQRNRLISKSLLKTVVIDDEWTPSKSDAAPEDGQFWLVDIVHETQAGENRGCFVCHPLRRVDFKQVNHLLPGMFEERWHDQLLVLEPKVGGVCWMLPLRHRHRIQNVYAVIVSQ